MWKPGNRNTWKQITRTMFLALTALNMEGCGTLDFSSKITPVNPEDHSMMRGARGLRRISLYASLTPDVALRRKGATLLRPKITDLRTRQI